MRFILIDEIFDDKFESVVKIISLAGFNIGFIFTETIIRLHLHSRNKVCY